MKKALIIGLGVSGQAAVHLLIKQGWQVVAIEEKAPLSTSAIQVLKEKGLQVIAQHHACIWDEVELVVVSPGIPLSHPVCAAAVARGIEIIGEPELALRHLTNPVIGITGTNGKTTVTMLVAHVLQQVGLDAQAYGNIGEPLCAVTADSRQIIVAELSSFQLETMHRPCLDAAVILNITPDHLDRYPSMEDYARAKVKIGACLKANAPFYVEEKCFQAFRPIFAAYEVCTYGYSTTCALYTDLLGLYHLGKKVCELPIPLQGKRSHDLENFMAAYALCQSKGILSEQFILAHGTFKKPAHRIEFVRNKNGIAYYDDSKGTNIDAVIRAVDSLKDPIRLIAGGVDKGASYLPWVKAFDGKVVQIAAIGQAAAKIYAELSPFIPVECVASLDEAVSVLSRHAKTGDLVLLSPGCSSFDMFKDYAHRGNEFKRIVNAL